MSIARRGRVIRKSLRDTLATNNAADKFYAAMAGKEPAFQVMIAPSRQIANRSAPDELEAAVSDEVEAVLCSLPTIIFAVRQNSGATAEYVSFWKWVKWRELEPATLPDYWGVATFGFWCLEAKRRDWTFNPKDDRQRKQKAFIDIVNAHGGRAGFVTSGAAALETLSQPSI